ncbi:hypothetical protein CCACVL1_15712, partial [Corchorus capsularis]
AIFSFTFQVRRVNETRWKRE